MNPFEEEKKLTLARGLRQAGVPLYIPEDDEPTSHSHTVGLHLRSLRGNAIQLNECFFGITIFAKIISNRSVPFYISGYDIELAWKLERPERFSLLQDPGKEYPPKTEYTFWDLSLDAYQRKDVLNHQRGKLRRFQPIEGLLLWMGEGQIPAEYVQGATLASIFYVLDQYGAAYLAPAALTVRRPPLNTNPRKRLNRNITGHVRIDSIQEGLDADKDLVQSDVRGGL